MEQFKSIYKSQYDSLLKSNKSFEFEVNSNNIINIKDTKVNNYQFKSNVSASNKPICFKLLKLDNVDFY